MKRRTALLGLGSLASGSSLLLGTGAFSSVRAERSASVDVADETDAYLAISTDATGGSVNRQFSETKGLGSKQLRLDFQQAYDTSGEPRGTGVGQDSSYRFDDVFTIQNQGTQPVFFWSTFTTATGVTELDVALYPGTKRETLLDRSPDVLEIGVGETVKIGVGIDTGENAASVSGDDGTLTIHADADKPSGTTAVQPNGGS